VKAAVGTTGLITLLGEDCRASRVRENLMHGSYGEGLETGRCQAPRQSFTRQLFFRWIKQHLRIKTFYGTSPNAVKTQIWIAVSIYLLVAILKKRLDLPGSLHTILQILEVNIFEKKPIIQIVKDAYKQEPEPSLCNQLNLFNS
jgi:hypothetical protein